MELINVAILTEDLEYGTALAYSLVRNTKGMEVWVYTDPLQMVKESRLIPIDLTIAEKNCAAPGDLADFILVEKYSEEPAHGETDDDVLFKYGNIKNIIDRLYLKYTRKTGRQIISDAAYDCEVYTFVSEHGGSGCTSAAMDLAKEFAVYRNRRTLFISLTQFGDAYCPGFREDMESCEHEKGAKNLKQYLYQLICRHEAGEYTAIDSYLSVDKDSVCHFIYPDSPNPLLELYENGFLTFIKTITSSGRFDAIIIDAGNQVSMPMVRSMQASNLVYFVMDDRGENNRWRRCIEGIIDGKTVNNIVPVKKKCDKIVA